MCSPQVCCLRFLFPFADEPEALTEFLRPVFHAMRQVPPMEGWGCRFVTKGSTLQPLVVTF